MPNDLNVLSHSHQESAEQQKKMTREIYVARKQELDTESALDAVLENEL
jgi:hypothetical protein